MAEFMSEKARKELGARCVVKTNRVIRVVIKKPPVNESSGLYYAKGWWCRRQRTSGGGSDKKSAGETEDTICNAKRIKDASVTVKNHRAWQFLRLGIATHALI